MLLRALLRASGIAVLAVAALTSCESQPEMHAGATEVAGLAALEQRVTRLQDISDLKRLLGATDGNLTVHARRLEDAGYVTCTKTSDQRIVRTTFTMAPAGRAALRRYLAQMAKLAEALR